MTSEEFNHFLEERLTKTRAVLASKSQEYGKPNDRLYNFHRAGEVTRRSSAEALLGMASKPLVSVMDMMEAFAKWGKVPTRAELDEKVGDLINYLILFEAMALEKVCQQEVANKVNGGSITITGGKGLPTDFPKVTGGKGGAGAEPPVLKSGTGGPVQLPQAGDTVTLHGAHGYGPMGRAVFGDGPLPVPDSGPPQAVANNALVLPDVPPRTWGL